MKAANIRSISPLVAVEFHHGFEIIPTAINGKRTQWASIDADGAIVAWASPTPPEFDNGAWCLDTDDLQSTGLVAPDDGSTYQQAVESLRRITIEVLLAA